jgi:glutamine synthetase adenylyltransferase
MSNIKMGNVSGTNLQVGDNNTQNITINQQDRDQIVSLLDSLHQQIQQAPIPEETKQAITQHVLPTMQEAVKQPDPKPGLAKGLEDINKNLANVNTAASSVSEIVGTVSKIAGIIGIGIKVAAPFLAGFL